MGPCAPTFMSLDDGWQSVRLREGTTNERRLTAFKANEKFPGDLRPTVATAKNDFGIETFIVWHTIMGYWGGVDPNAFPQYDIRPQEQNLSPGIKHYLPKGMDWWRNHLCVPVALNRQLPILPGLPSPPG